MKPFLATCLVIGTSAAGLAITVAEPAIAQTTTKQVSVSLPAQLDTAPVTKDFLNDRAERAHQASSRKDERIAPSQTMNLSAATDYLHAVDTLQARIAAREARQEARQQARQEARQQEREQAVAESSSTPEPPSSTSTSSAPTGSNQQIGMQMAAERGWTGSEWTCLDSLFTRESGWSTTAYNSSSGAYGIPQALPGSKMAVSGSDWETNPATQIDWGLDYIAGRYGSPCGAWSHSESYGWY